MTFSQKGLGESASPGSQVLSGLRTQIQGGAWRGWSTGCDRAVRGVALYTPQGFTVSVGTGREN